MLKHCNAIANVPVRDLAAARDFYTNVLGLSESGGDCVDIIEYTCGDSRFFVYKSDYAGTNRATTMTWDVGDDIENVVSELKSKGIAFEHYPDLPDTRLVGDIHVTTIHGEASGMKVAWFKDPSGNIISLASSKSAEGTISDTEAAAA